MSVTAEITIGTVQDTLSWIQEFSVKFVEVFKLHNMLAIIYITHTPVFNKTFLS